MDSAEGIQSECILRSVFNSIEMGSDLCIWNQRFSEKINGF